MEFSFDRSRNTNPNSAQQTTAKPQANAQSSTDEVDTSQIANERLRKAIERNRARQRDREAQPGRTAPAASSAWAQHQAAAGVSNPREEMENHQQASLFEQQQKREEEMRAREEVLAREHLAREEAQARELRAREEAQMRAAQTQSSAQASQATSHTETTEEQVATPTRRTVARPHDTEFTPVRRTSKRAAAQISYTTGSKKKGKELNPKYVEYLVKGSWIFCGFLVLRLIFASGGVVSYFSQRSALNDRLSDLSKIRNENMSLVREIERMQLDAGYQKKLVRDNLGFIAQDEFLILFPKD